MRTLAIVGILALLIPVLSVGIAQAQTNVTVDPVKMNLGFMNVFNLPAPDGDGAFQFGGGWGFADLTGVFSGSDLTLGPNVIGDPNEYWYQCVGGTLPPDCGGPGAPGNKIMEANGYAEETGTLAGQTVIFSGTVLANSLTTAHTVTAFIRDFAPDFSSFNESSIPLSSLGAFSLSLATVNDAGRHVQYGFQMVGVNVWVTDVGPFGSMTIGPEMPIATESSSFGQVKSLFR